MSYANSIKKMIEDGNDILHVAKLFGGIDRLLEISKTSPYLVALIQTKLGGYLHCSAENEDGDMIPFSLNFVMTELEEIDDGDDLSAYNAIVDVIIPEIQKSPALMQMLLTWLDDYLSDMGAEVGQFNDEKLNNKMVWIYVQKINGKQFELLKGGVSDREVLQIIPSKYEGK